MEESANILQVSTRTIKRLLTKEILPGRQIVPCAPWIIKRQDLDLPEVRKVIQAVQQGRQVPRTLTEEDQFPLFTGD
jgi:hypothetical protein